MSKDRKSNPLFFIGDIHGEYHQLRGLLHSAGIQPEGERWAIRKEKPVFLGDLIDGDIKRREVDELAVLNLVRSLVEQQRAYCIMGNHELNAIGFATLHPETGKPLREHNTKNIGQHASFLNTVGQGSQMHKEWIEWFKTLPLFIDFGDARAIHACWHPELTECLKPYLNADNSLKSQYWPQAFDPGEELHDLLETLLKGPEIKLPEPHSFLDNRDNERRHIRIKWWLENATTYRDVAISVPAKQINNIPLIDLPINRQNPVQSVPVFVGHYKHYELLSGEEKAPLSPKVACLDYYIDQAVDLTGYLFKGETILTKKHFQSINER